MAVKKKPVKNDKDKNISQFVPEVKRVMIEKVSPQIDSGVFPAKRVVGEQVVVKANIFIEAFFYTTSIMRNDFSNLVEG